MQLQKHSERIGGLGTTNWNLRPDYYSIEVLDPAILATANIVNWMAAMKYSLQNKNSQQQGASGNLAYGRKMVGTLHPERSANKLQIGNRQEQEVDRRC